MRLTKAIRSKHLLMIPASVFFYPLQIDALSLRILVNFSKIGVRDILDIILPSLSPSLTKRRNFNTFVAASARTRGASWLSTLSSSSRLP